MLKQPMRPGVPKPDPVRRPATTIRATATIRAVWVMLALAGLLLSLTAASSARAAQDGNSDAGAARGGDDSLLCRTAIVFEERSRRIPSQLLSAISLAESGRWNKQHKELRPWPWTVYAEGRGRYFKTKERAIREVRALKKKGVRNIDVGCMQVNLYYHPKAFDSLETAFDPASNVAYAGDLLTRLHKKTRSWSEAMGRYHSSTRSRKRNYAIKIMDLWHKERRRVFSERRAAAQKRYEELRQARLQRERQRGTSQN